MQMIFGRGSPVWFLPLLFVVVAFGGIAQPMAQPSTSQAAQADLPGLPGIPGLPSPCDAIPDSTARKICKAVSNPAGTAIDAIPGIPGVPNISGTVAKYTVDPILERLAQVTGGYVLRVWKSEQAYINSSTTPNLNQNWFVHMFDWFFWYADIIAVIGLFAAVVIDVWRVNLSNVGWAFARYTFFVAFIATLPQLVNSVSLVMSSEVTPQILALANQQSNNLFNSVIAKANHDLGGTGDVYAAFGLLLVGGIGAVVGLIIKIILNLVVLGIYFYTLTAALSFAAFVFGRSGSALFIKNLLILGALIMFKPIMALVFLMSLSIANSPHPGSDTITMVVALMIGTLAIPVAVYRMASNHQVNAVDPVRRGAARTGRAVKTVYLARTAKAAAAAL